MEYWPWMVKACKEFFGQADRYLKWQKIQHDEIERRTVPSESYKHLFM